MLVSAVETGHTHAGLRAGIDYALTSRLSQSPRLRVASRARVDDALRLVGQNQAARLDRIRAREAAPRDGGIRWVIAPKLVTDEASARLTIDVVSAQDGTLVASVTSDAGALDEWPALADNAAACLSAHFGDTAPGRVTSIDAGALVGRAHAAALFEDARRLAGEGRQLLNAFEVERLAREALVADAAFVPAYALLAHALDWQGRSPESKASKRRRRRAMGPTRLACSRRLSGTR